ncbi:MAG: biotin transporter BioY [Clostridia bacterium]|nr:biotin transporter BioY [Clostridia bacterium]
MMAACISICSWINIPFIVPFTLQTFGVFLALKVLGGKRGTISIALYIILGLIGMPVFSGFRGGLYHIMGPTGGYISGFLVTGLVYYLLKRFFGDSVHTICIMIVSLIPCYLFGSIWFAIAYTYLGKPIHFLHIIGICIVPFIVPDILKILLANFIGEKLNVINSER